MAMKRQYDDGCGTAHALELVGERWALLIVRELMLGPKRFTDLRHDLPGISPNVLTQRLEELEAASIVTRHRLPPPAAAWVYDLTSWGKDLEPLICEFGRWAARSPIFPEGRPMSVNSLILSFRTMFSGAAAKGFRARIGLILREHEFIATIGQGRISIAPERARESDAVFDGDPNALAQVVYGGRTLKEAIRSGDLEVSGNIVVAARFVTLFPLPQRAEDTSNKLA